jgi:hypothetical protein
VFERVEGFAVGGDFVMLMRDNGRRERQEADDFSTESGMICLLIDCVVLEHTTKLFFCPILDRI